MFFAPLRLIADGLAADRAESTMRRVASSGTMEQSGSPAVAYDAATKPGEVADHAAADRDHARLPVGREFIQRVVEWGELLQAFRRLARGHGGEPGAQPADFSDASTARPSGCVFESHTTSATDDFGNAARTNVPKPLAASRGAIAMS